MPISISGDGTLTGVSVGGLPDGIVDTDMLATSAVTTAKTNFTGDLAFDSGYGSAATAYGVRAWVNFNGTGTVSIRDSGNVSSITDNGTGDYSVNLTNNLPDANYCVTAVPCVQSGESDTREISINLNRTYSNSTFGLKTAYNGSTFQDRSMVCAMVVR